MRAAIPMVTTTLAAKTMEIGPKIMRTRSIKLHLGGKLILRIANNVISVPSSQNTPFTTRTTTRDASVITWDNQKIANK